MSKKIVIMPCFGEGHLIDLQIQNLINTINPTHIIYNEGLFPRGPENKGGMDKQFHEKYCYKDTNQAWDTELVQEVVKKYQDLYSDKTIIWNPINYSDIDANDCYVHSVSNFEDFNIDIEEGDLIFPLEGDVFFHENDMSLLNEMIDNLNPDEGLQAPYLDFWQNQYYVEGNALDSNQIHNRRIVLKFGTWDYYKNVVYNFTAQKYPQLKMFPRYIFHYAWWRPGKYLDLRFSQLLRPADYHNDMRNALKQAGECKDNQITLRKDHPVDSLTRYIVRIDIDHPKHAKQHPNYIK